MHEQPSPETLAYIRDSLDYNPKTGDLRWVIPPREGELAGAVHSIDNNVTVGIRYRKYAASRIAVYLHTGKWPDGKVSFQDRNPTNLAIANLVVRPLLNTPKAVYARTLRQRQKAEEAEALRAIEGHSTVPGVRFTVADIGGETDDARRQRIKAGLPEGYWLACDPLDKHRVRAQFGTQDEAEKFQRLFEHADRYIDSHPQPLLSEELGAMRAGSTSGLTLAQAHALICYDAEYGVFYWRLGRLRAYRADTLNTRKRPVVTFASRQYPAAMLAWFLSYHEWPPRKSIIHRDRDPCNVALANLFIPPVIDRTRRVETMQEATE